MDTVVNNSNPIPARPFHRGALTGLYIGAWVWWLMVEFFNIATIPYYHGSGIKELLFLLKVPEFLFLPWPVTELLTSVIFLVLAAAIGGGVSVSLERLLRKRHRAFMLPIYLLKIVVLLALPVLSLAFWMREIAPRTETILRYNFIDGHYRDFIEYICYLARWVPAFFVVFSWLVTPVLALSLIYISVKFLTNPPSQTKQNSATRLASCYPLSQTPDK
jgi:hypothetical protein